MRIVVLTKPVPDPASGGERLLPDGRLDRANSPAVVNGNDEYVLEKALKLIEAAGDGEVILLTMAPESAPETMRKALAMGATRGVLVTDPAIAGSDTVATTRILAAALKLFVEQGYFNTNVPDLSRESKCSVGSIYHNFTNKEEVATALYKEGMTLFRRALQQAVGNTNDISQIVARDEATAACCCSTCAR